MQTHPYRTHVPDCNAAELCTVMSFWVPYGSMSTDSIVTEIDCDNWSAGTSVSLIVQAFDKTARDCNLCLQAACRELTDLLKHCYQCADAVEHNPELCSLQSSLLCNLMIGLWEPADYVYFGEHAYPLAQRWLQQQVQKYNEAPANSLDVSLPTIHEAYWTMLGEFVVMLQLCSSQLGCILAGSC